jgi:hypothetical protein
MAAALPKLRVLQSSWRKTRQKYLQWFEPTNAWRFRRAVPKHLRAIIGLTEWTETLKARTENEAIRLVLPQIEKTDQIIALADGGNWPPIPDEDVHTLCYAWKNAEPNLEMISSTEVPYSVERFLIGPRELRFKIDYQVGDHPIRWEMPCRTRTAIAAILDNPERIAAFRRNPDAVRRLIHECRRSIAINALQTGQIEPFHIGRPATAYAPPALAPALAPAPAPVSSGFPPLALGTEEAPDKSDLVSKWAKETDPDPRWLYQTRLSMKKLATLVGHDDATQVTRNDVIRFKEQLDEKGLKPATINRYLSEIKAPFAWAFKNDKIGIDPGEGVVFARKSKGQTKRLGYTDEQARIILLSARDEELPHRRWIPWVCAFTGTRLDEIAGRDVSDIEKIGSYWVLNIPEAKTPGLGAQSPFPPGADPGEVHRVRWRAAEEWAALPRPDAGSVRSARGYRDKADR